MLNECIATMSSMAPTPSATTLIIFGAGGHGRVVADAALLENSHAFIVASDRDAALCKGDLLPGVPLRAVDDVSGNSQAMHIAIGNNAFRQKEAAMWGMARLASVVHPDATVSKFSRISPGCFVAARAVIGPAVAIAHGVIVNHGAVIDHDSEIGAFSHIAPNATVGGHVKTGQRVLVGAGAVLLPMVVLGDDVTVGAGAVVNVHLPEPGVYAGIPARKVQ